jgi:hypothetical protein
MKTTISALALAVALAGPFAASGAAAQAFNRIASFPVNLNLPEGADPRPRRRPRSSTPPKTG